MHHSNSTEMIHLAGRETEMEKMELYSIVLSTTMLVLAILFGGGGCVTVLIAMCVHNLLRKLRYILLSILLLICCLFDFVWCPIEITRMVVHHENFNTSAVSNATLHTLKHISTGFYIILVSALASIIVLICVQNILKILHKYDSIPKVKFGIISILIWLMLCTCLTIVYVIIAVQDDNQLQYHTFDNAPFYFKMGVQTMWILLLLMPAALILLLHMHTNILKTNLMTEASDLHSNDNFTVPSLIIKSVEEIDEENEQSEALPSPDIQHDSSGGSPVSKSSKSALKKRSGSPSSQKVLFADMPSPSKENPSPSIEKFKSPNHLGVNMAAILGRRRHTIAQITEPHLDMMQKAKSYSYVRKFSVDISALQAQLENPKLSPNFQFHSQQELKGSDQNKSDQELKQAGKSSDNISGRSRDEVVESQDIAEEPENESDNEAEDKGASDNEGMAEATDTQSMLSQTPSFRSNHSARDSLCPTPPLISLTQSDGEEKQLEPNTCNTDTTEEHFLPKKPVKKFSKPCKLSCLLIAIFIVSILPMLVTEVLRYLCLSSSRYINTITCMTAISLVQTMIYPQVIFCVDLRINRAVHCCFVKTRQWMTSKIFCRQQEVPTTDDISDTEL